MESKTRENTDAKTTNGVYRSYSTTWGRYTNQSIEIHIEFTTTVWNFRRWWSRERLIAGMAEALAEKTCGGNSKEASRSSSSGTLTWYTPRRNTFKEKHTGKVLRTTAIRFKLFQKQSDYSAIFWEPCCYEYITMNHYDFLDTNPLLASKAGWPGPDASWIWPAVMPFCTFGTCVCQTPMVVRLKMTPGRVMRLPKPVTRQRKLHHWSSYFSTLVL